MATAIGTIPSRKYNSSGAGRSRERTRELDGAHVDFFKRIRNPIGVKLGPSTTPETMERLIDVLDPEREPGRLTFITRMGAGTVRDALPPLLDAIRGVLDPAGRAVTA